jgi:hypothetical protein
MGLPSLDEIQKWLEVVTPWAVPFIADHAVNKSPLKSNSVIELILVLLKKLFSWIKGHIIFLLSFLAAMSFVICLFFLLIVFRGNK